MELVAGPPITKYCDAHGLDLKARLDLFASVCHAVQHAHQKGIIHRDLKPSNILVAGVGAVSDRDLSARPDPSRSEAAPTAQPKVIDFGIARAIENPRCGGTFITEQGQMIGTPEYMSPEQAAAQRDIDTRTDVYSLGVLLYELLTGSTPVERTGAPGLGGAGVMELQRLICEREPPTPSTRVKTLGVKAATVAHGRRTDPAALCRMLRGDLDWIVMKALDKDRERRYETVNSLAMDIRRHLSDEPVIARPPTASYRFRKFARRNRFALAAGVAMLVLLVGGVVGTSLGMFQAIAARDAALAAQAAEIKQRERAEAINAFIRTTLQSSSPFEGGSQDMRVADAMMQAVKEIDAGAFKENPRTEAGLLETIATILNGNGRADKALPLAERALALQQRLHAGDHPDRAASLLTQGLVLKNLGRVAEAEPLYHQALQIYERLYKGDHNRVARSLNALAEARMALGRAAEAEPLLQRALDISRRLFHGDDPVVAVSLNNLAQARQYLGRMAEAEPLYEEALEMNQRLFRDDHPDVADSLNNLAFARQALGCLEEAEPLYQQALAMNQRLFEGDHPYVARSLNNLAYLWRVAGRTSEAEPLYRQALEMHQRLYDGDHPTVAMGFNNVATAWTALGRAAEAEPLFQQAVDMSNRLYPGGHPESVLRMINLARCRAQLGRLAEALILAQHAADTATRVLPSEHPIRNKCDKLFADLRRESDVTRQP
jgi:non-specific serine/threonine protein kinase/serine/threonine-protein kinase